LYAAYAAAKTNQIDLAFDYLKISIDLGLSDIDKFVSNEHMKTLNSDP